MSGYSIADDIFLIDFATMRMTGRGVCCTKCKERSRNLSDLGERPAASLGRNTRKGSMGWFLSKTSTSCIDSRPEKQEKHGNLIKLPRGREEKLVCLGSKSKLRLAWRSLLVLPCCMILKLPLNTTDCSFSGSVDRPSILYFYNSVFTILSKVYFYDPVENRWHSSCVSLLLCLAQFWFLFLFLPLCPVRTLRKKSDLSFDCDSKNRCASLLTIV